MEHIEHLIEIITSPDAEIRNRSLDGFCARLSAARLLEECAQLEAFRQRHDISFSQLEELSGGAASSSTFHRLFKGQLEDEKYIKSLRVILAERLPKFLTQRGLIAVDIDRELLTIFDKGEYTPMINARTTLQNPKFFGLSSDPFALVPKSRDEIFISREMKLIKDKIIDAIKYQHFIAVTGEIGAGKTTLRMLIEDEISRDSNLRLIIPETFDMSKVTASAIMREMLEELGEYRLPRSPVSQAKLLKRVISKSPNRNAVFFDECKRDGH